MSGAGVPLLEPVILPDHARHRLAGALAGLTLCRAGNSSFALGLVLPHLAQIAPFSEAPLGLRVWLTGGEILRGHHLMVMQGGRLVAYAGWAACTETQGLRFLSDEGIEALDMTLREAPAMAFLTLTASRPEARAALRTALRALHPGRRYFARRLHGRPGRPVMPRGGVITPLSGVGDAVPGG